MKTTFIVGAICSTAALVGAQATFNPSTGTFSCPPNKSAFCASDSLVGNIIIRCTGTVGQPGNCNDNLAGVPPPGVKTFAPCWQCSPTSGNAACSYADTVYPDSGSNFTVAQGDAACNSTSTSSTPATLSPVTPLPSATSPSASASQASAALTSTATVRESTTQTLALPSSVPVAPGSGGYSNSSSTFVEIATAPVGTGSQSQGVAAGTNGGSGASSTSSPIAGFTGSAGTLTSTRQVGFAAVLAGLLVVLWC